MGHSSGGKNDIHQPVISPYTAYERIILWLNPHFLMHITGTTATFKAALSYQQKENEFDSSNKKTSRS